MVEIEEAQQLFLNNQWKESAMFELFDDRAKKVVALAKQEAQRFNHEYLSTEHILLAIIQEGKGVAVHVMRTLGVTDLFKVRYEVEKLVQVHPPMVALGQLLFTPRTKKVFDLAKEESSHLGHSHIGTEHLLLGIICENDGAAAQVLLDMGFTLKDTRDAVCDLTGGSKEVVKQVSVETPPTEPLELTRQSVRRRITELRKKGASKKDARELRGRIVELEAVLSALPQDDAIPELGPALARISALDVLLQTAQELLRKWKDGEISDEEFIAQAKAITF